MTSETVTKTEEKTEAVQTARKPRTPRTKNKRTPRRRARVQSEFQHRVIDIRRVSRVVAGGRRFSFSVTLVAGDRKGRVGIGLAKSGDTANAINKAMRQAKKNMITVGRTANDSIAHEVSAKYASALVRIFPSPVKGGVTAGGAVRTVLELAGVKNVGAKVMSRSKNKLNNARAAVRALKKLPAAKKVEKKEKK